MARATCPKCESDNLVLKEHVTQYWPGGCAATGQRRSSPRTCASSRIVSRSSPTTPTTMISSTPARRADARALPARRCDENEESARY